MTFWDRVDTSGECWLWTGYRLPNGYGQAAYAGQRYAHRVAYVLTFGPIPEGMTIDHLCRVRHCVRPSHLEAVTNRDNILRGTGASARNASRTECTRGHALIPFPRPTRAGKRYCPVCLAARREARNVARRKGSPTHV